MAYDAEECETSLNAFIHEMSDLEAKGCWMRAWCASSHTALMRICVKVDMIQCCRLNMGTADELALDVLINALSTLSKEYVSPLHAVRHRAARL